MALPELPLGRLKALAPWLDRAVPLGFGLALLLLTPWRTAFQFGMDEGFELMKALLVSRGHRLYGEFWNDQPPLHTEVLALLFRLFGSSAGVGRVLSVGFAVVLVAALYGLARRGSNRLTGLVAVLLLAGAPGVLELSVSVMLELPAFALGLAAVWAWNRWETNGRRAWLVGSGVLMGCALQVKFTAALLLPALAVAWCLPPGASGAHSSARADASSAPAGSPSRVATWLRGRRWRAGLLWLAALAGAFGLVVALSYGPGAWAMFWTSHFSAGTRAGAAMGRPFQPSQLLAEPDLGLAALAGVLLQVKLRRRELWFPLVWLVTALLVHLNHRPYWPYYYLHFAIPLAWLGGAGLVEGFRFLWRKLLPPGQPGWTLPCLGWGLWSLFTAWVLSLALGRGEWELGQLRQDRLAAEQSTVQRLRAHAGGVQWLFTTHLLSAFWAGLPVPPELAVLPRKRWWSGQMSPEALRAALERHRPELIHLPGPHLRDWGLEGFLAQHYQPVDAEGDLYRRR